MQQMFEMLEMVTDIKETQIEKAVKLGDMHLCNLTGHCKLLKNLYFLTNVMRKLNKNNFELKMHIT